MVSRIRTSKQQPITKKACSCSHPPVVNQSSSRIAELPSLRYGIIGSRNELIGPLIVRNNYKSEIRKSSRSHQKTTNLNNNKNPSVTTRSVRFVLPSSENGWGKFDGNATIDGDVIRRRRVSRSGARDADDASNYYNLLKRTADDDSNRCSCNIRPCASANRNRTNGTNRFITCVNCCKKSSPTKARTFEQLVAHYEPSDEKWLLRDKNPPGKSFWTRNNNNRDESYSLPFPQRSRPPRTRVNALDTLEEKQCSWIPFCDTSETFKNNRRRRLLLPVENPSSFNGKSYIEKEEKYIRNRSSTPSVAVLVSVSPADGRRVHPTGYYIKGTLSPTTSAVAPVNAPPPGGQALIQAARDGDDDVLRDILKKYLALGGSTSDDINAADSSGRTALSYIVSNGPVDVLQLFLQLHGVNPNKADNEGNTPLHFAAQAGQTECMNVLLTRCKKNIEIDGRNNLGFTPLMKAALQGRSRCAKLLLLSGANPTLRDYGRGFRADQWARYCGRYLCADVIEKHARQRLLEKSTSYGNWGGENESGPQLVLNRPIQTPTTQQHVFTGLRHKLRKVFRTSSNTSVTSQRLITQLTSAALCASTPVLPTAPKVPSVVKSLIRPLSVPQLQITLVSNNNDEYNRNNNEDDDDDGDFQIKNSVGKSTNDDKVRLTMLSEIDVDEKY